MQQFFSLLSWRLFTAQHVSGVFPPINRSSMTAVASFGFTFVSWWQSCCVRGWAGRPGQPRTQHELNVKFRCQKVNLRVYGAIKKANLTAYEEQCSSNESRVREESRMKSMVNKATITPLQATRLHDRLEVQLHSFLTSALVGQWSASRPSRNPATGSIRGWFTSTVGMDVFEKNKSLSPCQKSNHDYSVD
jgi:hypothetical protein